MKTPFALLAFLVCFAITACDGDKKIPSEYKAKVLSVKHHTLSVQDEKDAIEEIMAAINAGAVDPLQIGTDRKELEYLLLVNKVHRERQQ